MCCASVCVCKCGYVYVCVCMRVCVCNEGKRAGQMCRKKNPFLTDNDDGDDVRKNIELYI